jgi:hypothetical protein
VTAAATAGLPASRMNRPQASSAFGSLAMRSGRRTGKHSGCSFPWKRSSSLGDLETAQMDELRQPPVGDVWLVGPPDEAE